MSHLRISLLLVACAAPSPAPIRTAAPSPLLAPAAPVAADPKACGELGCQEYSSAEKAFAQVLAEEPRVLALGEAHAQKGSEGVASTAKRFGEQLLPLLRGRATDIVIELLIADGKCGKPVEEHVAEQQRPVTENQAASNQNEFIELGTLAKRQGTEPHALTPTCAEYTAISNAGDDAVDTMLTTVADASVRTLSALLKLRASNALLLAYGGALHNDIAPREGREKWSFGPRLSELGAGKYVELDLIVPEYVKDSETWRAFPWYSAYSQVKGNHGALLYRTAPHSFVLIFPRSSP